MIATMNSHTSLDMTHGPLASAIIRFAIPIALANILQQLFNSADIAVVGHFCGKAAMAAVGANSSIINLQICLFTGVATGVTVVIAQSLGKGDRKTTRESVSTAIIFALISGIALAILGIFSARPLLEMVSAPEDVIDLAERYLQIYFAGMPVLMLYNFSSAILRSCGDTKRPLVSLFLAGIINVILNLLFVLVFDLAVVGVALATVISNMVSTGMLIFFLCKEQGDVHLDIRHMSFTPSIFMAMIRIGLPVGLQSMLFTISNVVIQSGFNSFGSACVAGNATGLTYESYTNYMANAFAQAAMTFSSQNYGARNVKRCKQVMVHTIVIGLVVVGAMCGICSLFAKPLCMLYTTDQEVLQFAVWRIQYAQRFQWSAVFYNVASGILRSIGYSIIPTLISVFGVCIFRLIWIATIFSLYHTYPVLVSVYPITWSLTSVMMLIAYFLIAPRTWKRAATSSCQKNGENGQSSL